MRRWLVNSRWKSAKFRRCFSRMRLFSNLYQIRCDDGIVFQPVVLTWSSWTVSSPTTVRHLSRPTFTGRFICTYLYKLAFPYPLEVWGTIFSVWRDSSWRSFSTFLIILFRCRNDLTSVHLDQNKKSFSPSFVGYTCQKHNTLCTVPLNVTIAVHSHLTQSSFFSLFATAYTFFKESF